MPRPGYRRELKRGIRPRTASYIRSTDPELDGRRIQTDLDEDEEEGEDDA